MNEWSYSHNIHHNSVKNTYGVLIFTNVTNKITEFTRMILQSKKWSHLSLVEKCVPSFAESADIPLANHINDYESGNFAMGKIIVNHNNGTIQITIFLRRGCIYLIRSRM